MGEAGVFGTVVMVDGVVVDGVDGVGEMVDEMVMVIVGKR